MIVTILDRVNSLKHYAKCFVLLNVTDSLQSEKTIGLSLNGILCKFYVNYSKNRLLHMQITADSIGVYTKVFSLSPYQNFDVIRQWSVQWCLIAGPSCLILGRSSIWDLKYTFSGEAQLCEVGCEMGKSLTIARYQSIFFKSIIFKMDKISPLFTVVYFDASNVNFETYLRRGQNKIPHTHRANLPSHIQLFPSWFGNQALPKPT